MGPGEGVGSIPDGIGGEGISGTVSGLGLVEGVIGIIGGEAMDIGGGAIGIGGGAIGMGGGVIIGIGDIAGGMDIEPEGAIMGA
ncbi:putative mediator of RNA polymerase II transcription subunit 17 [Arabidopsis lyrata subsp. lyrata]|uniref:putative mediator of RNA polymerase II transcription subunit 17 n=1 Tax=Arabidopsis lyrata subsp. lyrata TaxID=81972 RepID=UPI000A29AD05|nr:putative mediator of RNA polymerase II transcription subunit 17 [Arabidopsis lyrata subsp. lyrata]|eukprot:XP_020875219.1 putative mediator of RNA polymerase II transcription subunit 17 [Arabidopsis lyrata subsp. lyrata]